MSMHQSDNLINIFRAKYLQANRSEIRHSGRINQMLFKDFNSKDTVNFINKVSSMIPFPKINTDKLEYPRPQFVRDKWASLNGEWDFSFDEPKFDKKIKVPYPYQSELSGIGDKTPHETVWYRKKFEVPKGWDKEDLMLHFGAVDYESTVWVNGKQVRPPHKGGHVPFSANIQPYLKPDGPNELIVKVKDSQLATQGRGKQQSGEGKPFGINYYPATGIWQPVWIEPLPKIRIDKLKITPNAKDGSVEILAPLHVPAAGLKVQVQALDGEKVVANAEAENDGTVPKLKLNIPNAKLWSPENPNLYDLRVRLVDKDGIVKDSVESYTGIRNIGTKDGKITLNDKPYYLKMVLNQGYWKQSQIAAPSSKTLRDDVDLIKQFGFNTMRLHQKVEDPRSLYWADKKGLLVWGEMPNTHKWSLEGENEVKSEFKQEIQRDYNHPCIMAWTPLNEDMGVEDISKDYNQRAFIDDIVGRRHGSS